jgi:hypothetical protein
MSRQVFSVSLIIEPKVLKEVDAQVHSVREELASLFY